MSRLYSRSFYDQSHESFSRPQKGVLSLINISCKLFSLYDNIWVANIGTGGCTERLPRRTRRGVTLCWRVGADSLWGGCKSHFNSRVTGSGWHLKESVARAALLATWPAIQLMANQYQSGKNAARLFEIRFKKINLGYLLRFKQSQCEGCRWNHAVKLF